MPTVAMAAQKVPQSRIGELARRHDLGVLADEIYDRLYSRGPELGVSAPSILRQATRPRRCRDGAPILLKNLLANRLAGRRYEK